MNTLIPSFISPPGPSFGLAIFALIVFACVLICFAVFVGICVGRFRLRDDVKNDVRKNTMAFWPMAGWTFLIILVVLPVLLAIVGTLLDRHGDFADFWMKTVLATFLAGPVWLGITALVHRKMMIRVKLLNSPLAKRVS